ncbi:MAG: hypothetical protein MUE33_08405 [Cytophagaceae bacterium]|jgi:hypothetical protein|nr:hypothetical protein [Cytophagaceae bacterium]
MKKIVFALCSVVLLSAISSCKKEATEVSPIVLERGEADDASSRNEFDKIYDVAEEVFNSSDYDNSTLRTALTLPCGNVTLNTQNFTINYGTSTTCGSRVLSGTVLAELVEGTRFRDQNAVLKLTFINYKVLYTSTNQSLTYNGIAYVTNTTGGTLLSLFTTTPVTVTHKIRADLNVTYDSTGTGNNNVTREWNVFRRKTYTSNGSATGITLTLTGDTSSTDNSYIEGTYSTISEYGLNREGKKFINNVTQEFRWENCGSTYNGPYILKQGSVTHTAALGTIYTYTDAYGSFTATAGYFGTLGLPTGTLVNNCTSNGYLVDYKIRNGVNGTPTTLSTNFIPY